MKKLVALLSCLIFVCVLGACGPAVDKEALAPFVGEWDCQECTLEERGNEDYSYVGYFALRVEEDGTFSMYDAGAGNPGMAGTMYPDGGGNAQLQCKSDDFDPPFTWMELGIQEDCEVRYSFHEEGGMELLYLSYVNDQKNVSTLVFERME